MKHIAVCASLLVAIVVVCGAAFAGGSELLVRVERKTDEDLKVLRSADLPVVMEMDSCLFLQAGDADVNWLRDHGYDASVIDAGASNWDYLVVGMRPDSDRAAIERIGTVLLAENNWLLVRVPSKTSFESLAAAKVFIARMNHEPVSAPIEQASLVEGGGPGAAVGLAADPVVQQIVNTVSNTQIDQFWTDITVNSPTGTRYSTSQGCADAGVYCYNKYTSYKLSPAYQTWSTTHKPNIVATQEGAVTPSNVYIVIGHIDDLPSSGAAPGADDNGSGTVNVLESARVMSCYGFRSTVKYINCTGEEAGLLGSEAYAADAQSRGENILGVINMDMPGWAGDGIPNPENLDLDYNAASQDLAQRVVQAAANYGTGLPVDAFLCPSLDASDHYPFWTRGWKAVCGITDNEGYCSHAGNYPYYHTSNDTLANCGSRTFFYSVVRTSVATLSELAQPFRVTFENSAYACNTASIKLYLADRDLNTNASVVETVAVTVSSGAESTPETFVLTEKNANSMIFTGTIPLTFGPPVHGDGLLSVSSAGDVVTANYTDALDCTGATNVVYTSTAQVDCAAPVITNVQATNLTSTGATITWTTNEASTSVVHYGTSPPGSGTQSSATLVTGHSVPLSGLSSCTLYYFWVESADTFANNRSDNNGGIYYNFQTLNGSSPCGPHARPTSQAQVLDTCRRGGVGTHDGVWDPNEDVQFSVTVLNDGAASLTNVTATVTSSTPGVVMLNGTASFPNIPVNGSATSVAPHFTARLPGGLSCGDTIHFQVTISSSQGAWPDSFTHPVGYTSTPSGSPVNETFAAGIPATWTVVNGGYGGGTSATWNTANPCNRSIASPMGAPVAIVDSYCAGPSASQNEQLITPALDLSSTISVTLDFDQFFNYYSGGQSEIGDVDVKSSKTAGAWVNLVHNSGASSTNPEHKTIDITAQAAGATGVQVRFHYYQGAYEFYWEVDNVRISYVGVTGCAMHVCTPGAALPPPVPDGTFGTPMTASRQAADGSSIAVHWDVATCTAADYHLLYGPLSGVSTYTLGGAACNLGTSGAYSWSGVPAGNVWYLVVADDDGATEGSWGKTSAGAQRGGTTASGQCGVTTRDNTGSCP